jgi:hypothetical protein
MAAQQNVHRANPDNHNMQNEIEQSAASAAIGRNG